VSGTAHGPPFPAPREGNRRVDTARLPFGGMPHAPDFALPVHPQRAGAGAGGRAPASSPRNLPESVTPLMRRSSAPVETSARQDGDAFRLLGCNLSAVIPGLAIQVGLTDLDGRSPESITPARRVVYGIAR
jgi:hypothetical protein